MESFIGEITLVAFSYAPPGFLKCQGQTMQISENEALYAILGTRYGGDGQATFLLPNLIAPTNLNYIICVQGLWPSHS